jgi:hypothetical protein
MPIRRLVPVSLALAVCWIIVAVGTDSMQAAANLPHSAWAEHPYFVSSRFWLLYVWAPVLALSSFLLVLSPGMALLSALGGDSDQDRWLLKSLGLGLIVTTASWRVLSPGGVFVVQETNTRNPLFRLYMSYLFPLPKSIDEGTECWIEPERWADVPGFDLRDTIFFTFLPDFAPRFALPVLRAIESRLERGSLKSQSVHYQAVLRKGETVFGSSPLFGEPGVG